MIYVASSAYGKYEAVCSGNKYDIGFHACT